MGNNSAERASRPKAEQEIDENLKRAFESVANEPLPDRFSALLEQLKSQEEDGKSK